VIPAAGDRPAIAGYWDYDNAGRIVTVDLQGAATIECAWPPGDQLRHLSCPAAGPCSARERP
jgi:hypothetical protein